MLLEGREEGGGSLESSGLQCDSMTTAETQGKGAAWLEYDLSCLSPATVFSIGGQQGGLQAAASPGLPRHRSSAKWREVGVIP